MDGVRENIEFRLPPELRSDEFRSDELRTPRKTTETTVR
jgi:hypothetical protein